MADMPDDAAEFEEYRRANVDQTALAIVETLALQQGADAVALAEELAGVLGVLRAAEGAPSGRRIEARARRIAKAARELRAAIREGDDQDMNALARLYYFITERGGDVWRLNGGHGKHIATRDLYRAVDYLHYFFEFDATTWLRRRVRLGRGADHAARMRARALEMLKAIYEEATGATAHRTTDADNTIRGPFYDFVGRCCGASGCTLTPDGIVRRLTKNTQ